MQVGGAAHREPVSVRQYAFEVEAGVAQAALGFLIQRNGTLTAGSGLAPAALLLDQRTDAGAAISDDFRRAAYRRGDHLEADHHDAQVEPRMKAFQQHAAVVLPGALDGVFHFGRIAQVHGDAHALFAIHRLDHHAAVLGEERGIFLRAGSQLLRWQADARLGQGAVGQALVLAKRHADSRGQVG